MTEVLIRLPQVLAITYRSTSRIYSAMRVWRLPKPARFGVRAIAWHETEISQWINDRISDRDDRSCAGAGA